MPYIQNIKSIWKQKLFRHETNLKHIFLIGNLNKMLFAIFGISHVFTIYILSCFGTHFGCTCSPGFVLKAQWKSTHLVHWKISGFHAFSSSQEHGISCYAYMVLWWWSVHSPVRCQTSPPCPFPMSKPASEHTQSYFSSLLTEWFIICDNL